MCKGVVNMNAIVQSSLNLEPVFQAYERIAKKTIPTLEPIIDYYDQMVTYKLTEWHQSTHPYVAHSSLSWQNLSILDPEVLQQLEEQIGMKTHLEIKEMVEVFHKFHLMYVDNYSFIHNFPTKDVW